MKKNINENNINDIEQIIRDWLESDEKELTLVKNPSVLEISVVDSIQADGGLA